MHTFIQHLLSRLAGMLAKTEIRFIKHCCITLFCRFYAINLAEANISDPKVFSSFNAFFTRQLKKDVRTINPEPRSIISPVDGLISAFGFASHDQLFQAKGMDYSIHSLLANAKESKHFEQGAFLNAYLAPHNYHRVHMPCEGTLNKMIYVPGHLFSVSPKTVNVVPNLFARNERVIFLFDTPLGKMAFVMVGALIVGNISTVFTGSIAASRTIQVFSKDTLRQKRSLSLKKGEELGLFQLGSTIIMLFEKEKISWERMLSPEKSLRLGEKIGFF